MYIYYDDNFKVIGISSTIMKGEYIKISQKEYRKIEQELNKGFESFKVDIKENTVHFDEELDKAYKLAKKKKELGKNSKEIEISQLMLENEIIKKQLNFPSSLDMKTKWEKRIENNYVTEEQIEVLKELRII